MAHAIEKIITRYAQVLTHGISCQQSFSQDERRIIQDWLTEQRTAFNPDRTIWMQFLTKKSPYFCEYTRSVLRLRWTETIRYCGTRIDIGDLKEVEEEFPLLKEQGVRFLLNGINPQKIEVYAAAEPVLVGMQATDNIWRLSGSEQDNIGLKKADVGDVVAVALREWGKDKPQAKKARERLCDIFSKCFAQAA